ncbi:MAG: D-aminoacylase [Sphingomonadaceae bacterium]|jgi:N-acyl-D-amino-acid deacylase|nr:D-aminoacylase [Sphingomonadaceae bacterium]NBU78963.1 D-aminoacylase [Sphingomonadaceae bacterium]NCA01046.1 D-aminoacylase [Sphingomonadaceae bacterium]
MIPQRLASAFAITLGLAGLASPAHVAAETATVDLLIRGGTVYTGAAAAFTGDVAVSGDRIVAVGRHLDAPARRVIEAKGLIVAPGFIDPHTHADAALTSRDPAARLVLPFLTQGVTTAFIGVDGWGAPDLLRTLVAEAEGGIGVNAAAYVGLGAVRAQVVGAADRAATPKEMADMSALVSRAMCQGALGLSTGLFYAPQSFARADEVIALARAAALKGGLYDSHIRDESSYSIGLSGAIEEALNVGRQAKISVHIAHIKALGVDVQGQAPKIIAQIEAAQKAGIAVTADQYPWSASGTQLSAALMPRWAQDGGRAAMLARFDDPALQARLRADMAENLRKRGGPVAILITAGPKAAQGKTLEAVAKETGQSPVDATITLLRERETSIASFNQSEADIAAFMTRPWVMTSSDASQGHPRYYASFARAYATYGREKKVLTVQSFIERSTLRTARSFGLEGRGELKPGAFADVIVFDPNRFAPRADYAQPSLFSTGMRFVLVNGQLALDEGEPTGRAGGKALLRHPPSGQCP